ncbi:MAG: N-acetylmuramoyl-L-alanine amidase, partial [Frankiales bacterium]|nr:N-acetylmuramoyl-L-alanine amidase [Frankiales bacterium]
MRARLLALTALVPLAAALLPVSPAASAPAGDVRLEALSGRADTVTGGDAYVRVVLPAGTPATGLRVDDDGRDVTGLFRGRTDAVVTGLSLGRNVLRAVLPDGRGARLTLTVSPLGGPVISGPQIQPWACTPGGRDAQCSRPPAYRFLYKSTLGTPLQAYDPEAPAADVATTTTSRGAEVPFIVREETGVSVRDVYRIAVLYDPSQPWDPTAPQRGYDGKLVLTHGASCDTAYEMGSAPDVLLEDALSRGFAVASHALDNAGHNCNLATQAESLVVTKELVAERYGPIRYTIGTGCSGGSLTQQQVANAYPGVYQGILPQCSFTDAWSSSQQYVDYTLLRSYLEGPGAAASLITPAQYLQIYGHPNPANQVTFTEVIPNSGDPSRACPGVPEDQVFTTESQKGVRCTLQDYMVNVFGRSADGKARRPYDNVGIQYGLSGLQDGTLLPDQFVALNTGIGGYDIDLEPQAARTAADPLALQRVFRSGAVNTGAHLDQVAIIDLRGPDPGAFHDVYRTSSMTDRLRREHGTSSNQVLWEGPVPLLGSTAFVDQGIVAMDAWLAEVEKDVRAVPLARKVLEAKSRAGVTERCTSADGTDLPGVTSCAEVDATVFASPRIEAGGGADAVGYADDTMKCQLVPIESFDYAGRLSDAQVATLRTAFPTGVCDYSRPSVSKQDAVTWLSYDVVGGRELGPAPTSVPFRGRAAAAAAPGTGAPPAVGSLPT